MLKLKFPSARPGYSIRGGLLLFTLAIALSLGGLLTWHFGKEVEDAETAAYARVKLIADNAANNLTLILRDHEKLMAGLALRPLVKLIDPANCDPLIGDYIALHREFTQLAIRDLNGNIVCSYLPGPVKQYNITDQPWYFEGLRSGKFFVGDAVMGPVSKRWASGMTYTLRDTQGNPSGALVMGIDLLALNERVMGTVPKNAVASIIDRQEQFLLRSIDPQGWIGKRVGGPQQSKTQSQRFEREGFFMAPGSDGVRRVYAVARLPDHGWRVVAGISESELLAPVKALLDRKIAIGIAAALLVLSLTWWLGRAILWPMRRLAATVRDVAGGNPGARAALDGPREVAEIAREFNHLLDVHHRTQESLRTSELLWSQTIASLDEGVFVLEPSLRQVLFCNPAAERIFGYAKSELDGRTVDFMYLDREHFERFNAEMNSALGREGVFHAEFEARRKDGSAFACEQTVKTFEYSADGTKGLVSVVRDLTDRKNAESELIWADQRLSLVQRAARAGISDWNVATGMISWSNEFFKLFGLDPTSSTPSFETWRALVHPEDVEEAETRVLASIRDHLPLYNHYRIILPNGEIRWIDAFADTDYDRDGNALRMSGISIDVTERWKAEEARDLLEFQLRESQKMEAMGTLAGGIAHDFNNILGAIRGNAVLAKQDLCSRPDDALTSLEEIDKAAMRATGLVQRILAFSRRAETRLVAQDLRPLVEDSIGLLRATIPSGVDITMTHPDHRIFVRADATQISQILLNLGANSWHSFGGAPGKIEIKITQVLIDATEALELGALNAGGYARLTVRDNGCGMDATTLSHIFEPFFTTKEGRLGTGLGLSIVHGIVSSHGGAIAVKSEIGKGTMISVYLPTCPPEDAKEETSKTGAAPGAGQRVLYVDDEDSLVFLVKRVLDKLGYRTSGTTSATDAVAMVRTDPMGFDLVVSDYNMPGMSGLDVAREVLLIRPDLPVLLTSGYVTEQLRSAALKLGVRAIVYKPNTVDQLCASIADAFSTESGREY